MTGHPPPPRRNGYHDPVGTGRPAPTALTTMLTDGIAHAPASAARPAAASPPPPAAEQPTGTAGLAALPGALPVDASVIHSLQEAASKELTEADPDKLLSDEDRQQRARAVVRRLVAEWASAYAHTARPLDPDQEAAVRAAVFDSMFRAGPLQPLLDDDGVEDILLDGRQVVVEYQDRPRAEGPRLFASHQALVEWVNKMASSSGHGERQLSPASPSVGFRLPDGSRVTATTLTTKPVVTIRRHRIRKHGLADLQQLGTLSPALTQFLRACVEARRNILVAGEMGAGKTSLLRSLGRTIPAWERIVTLESDRELYLDDDGVGPYTLAMEARQSNGEKDDSGRPIGEVTIADMFPTALRLNAQRVIVGEVRSVEIVPMLQAMSAGGSGSMCTIHVRRTGNVAAGVMGRMLQLCTEAGLSEAASYRLIAASVDIVVYIELINETALGGSKHRFVSHVFEVHDIGEGGRPDMTDLFAPSRTEPRATVLHPPSFLQDLVREGRFDAAWLRPEHGAWPDPLTTKRPL